MTKNKFLIALMLTTSIASAMNPADLLTSSIPVLSGTASTATAIFQVTPTVQPAFTDATHPAKKNTNNASVLGAANSFLSAQNKSEESVNKAIDYLHNNQKLTLDFSGLDPKTVEVDDVYKTIILQLAKTITDMTDYAAVNFVAKSDFAGYVSPTDLANDFVLKTTRDAEVLNATVGYTDATTLANDFVLKTTRDAEVLNATVGYTDATTLANDYMLKTAHTAALNAALGARPFAALEALLLHTGTDLKYTPVTTLIQATVADAVTQAAAEIASIDTPPPPPKTNACTTSDGANVTLTEDQIAALKTEKKRIAGFGRGSAALHTAIDKKSPQDLASEFTQLEITTLTA